MSREVTVNAIENGAVLANRYLIRRALGFGGMGTVYQATDLNEEYDVAVKVLHSFLQNDRQFVERFQREVKMLSKVSHPNVVRMLDCEEDPPHLFYTMEYAPGITLDELIQQGPVCIDLLPRILLELSEGLQAIHDQGIVHRDIRPTNVILMDNYSLKIIDFGIACTPDSRLTQKNLRVGAVQYVAPEVWLGEQPGAKSDLYCLGLTAYELATGKIPVEETDLEALMEFHTRGELPSLAELKDGVPPWLSHMVSRLVMKDPAKRFRDASQVARFIRRNDEACQTIQSFSGAMASHTHRDGQNMISVFNPLSLVEQKADAQIDILRLSLNSSRLQKPKSGRLIMPAAAEKKPPKQIKIVLPNHSPVMFELKLPSLDYLFLGAFLISLNIFDGYLTHEGVSRLGIVAERNELLKNLMAMYGARTVLVGVKFLAILAVVFLTYLAHKSKYMRTVVAILSCIYLGAAVGPWIYLLYWQ